MRPDSCPATRVHRFAAPGGAIAFTRTGSGPPLLLVHGLGGTRSTWDGVLPLLARSFTVIAVDLPGHGESDAPLGDYSPGAQASALRDVVVGLGFDRVSLVGHSLGGGTVMQFAYQFPERTERLVLVSSGGLGSEVSPLLRAATLPGSEALLCGLAQLPRVVAHPALQALSIIPGLMPRADAASLADALVDMGSQRHRHTFVRTARTVLDLRGQVLSATGTVPALVDIPVLIAWGTDDKAIPPEHHPRVAERLPNAVTLAIPGAGHFPQETAPAPLAEAMIAFLTSSAPHEYDEDRWRSRVVLGSTVDA
jgi:pimeloyl-ACP methyl ester carboxylesterase